MSSLIWRPQCTVVVVERMELVTCCIVYPYLSIMVVGATSLVPLEIGGVRMMHGRKNELDLIRVFRYLNTMCKFYHMFFLEIPFFGPTYPFLGGGGVHSKWLKKILAQKFLPRLILKISEAHWNKHHIYISITTPTWGTFKRLHYGQLRWNLFCKPVNERLWWLCPFPYC